MSAFTPLLERPPVASPTAPAPRPVRLDTPREESQSLRQLVVSLIVLPLTLLPFVAYAMLTPEGRLVRDRTMVALFPPHLPKLSPGQRAAAVAAAPRYHGPVMALAYHGIGTAADGEGGFVVSPKRFGEHLAVLKAAGMRTVTAAEVADALRTGTPLPPNAVMLTFDDGRSDAMMFADPLLREAGMAATMFLIAGAASDPGVYYASWGRIETYARSGRWDIQSHTTDAHREHKANGGGSLPALTSLAPGETLAEFRVRVRDDLQRTADAIEDRVGRRPIAFAYPFGAYGVDRTNDPAIAEVLREEVARQYAVAFQQDDQETVPLVTADQDPLRLRRLEVENWSGLELLQRIERARQLTPGQPAAPPAPPLSPATPGETLPPPPATTPTVATNGAAPAPSAGPAGAFVTTPTPAASPTGSSVTTPPAPSVNTVPPVTPTVPPVTAAPPTTVTPTTTTRPPVTAPPTTAPPTTVCPPAGNSGKCRPGQGR